MTNIGRLSTASVYTAASGAPAKRGSTICDPRTPPTMGCGVWMRERWQIRSAQGPVALMIQVAFDAFFLPGQLISQ